MAGKILFTGRQTCSPCLVLLLCAVYRIGTVLLVCRYDICNGIRDIATYAGLPKTRVLLKKIFFCLVLSGFFGFY